MALQLSEGSCKISSVSSDLKPQQFSNGQVKDKETMKTEQVEKEEEKKREKRAFWVLVSKLKRHCFNLIFQHGCHFR